MDDTNMMMMMMMMTKPEEPPPIPTKSSKLKLNLNRSVSEFKSNDNNTENDHRWEGIPHDLLELVFLKPLEPIEYANILRVCKSWGEVKPPPCFPQAVLYDHSPTFTVEDIFYNEICLKIYCIGSYHGWLILKMFNKKKLDMEFYFLFNIFTRSGMLLPWLDRTTEEPAIFFSSAPTDPDCTLLMLDPSFPGFLFCNKQGCNSNKWIQSQCEYPLHSKQPCIQRNYLWTAITLGGKFYVLSSQGNLVAIDINNAPSHSAAAAAAAATLTVLPVTKIHTCIAVTLVPYDWFLVESLGELLMITCFRRKKDFTMTDLDVIRLDFKTMSWIKMESLPGDQVLFIAGDCSFSIGASEIWGDCTGEEEEEEGRRRGGGNYIYIADDFAKKTCRYDMQSHEMMVSTVFPGNYYKDLDEYSMKMLWARPPRTFV